jgi:hypothetical protein
MRENPWLCENQVDNGKITKCEEYEEREAK